MSAESLFLKFSCEKLAQLCDRIETCVAKLSPDEIWTRGGENENAVGNLLMHLQGNVRQWIITGIGGAPDHRDRDGEFNASNGDVSGLVARLRGTVDEACSVISGLPEERLTETRKIQNYDVTVLDAIYHVVEHFSMHTGQIIFVTKLLTGDDLNFYGHLKGSRQKIAHAEKTP